MPIVTTEQIRRRLSNPPWSAEQQQAVSEVSAQRESELAAWLRIPITPVRRVETVPVLDSGLVATSAPVHQLHAVNGVAVAGDDPPEGYTWRDTGSGDAHYLATTPPPGDDAVPPIGYSARPFSLLHGSRPQITVDYDAGWGPIPALTGAIAERVEAYAANRHDDTVTARALDAEAPPQQREHWIEDDLVALRAYRRAAI